MAKRTRRNMCRGRVSHRERARYLPAIATELERDSAADALVWTAETAVIQKYSKDIAAGLAGTFRAYADMAETFPFEERSRPKLGGELALLVGHRWWCR